jgi:putative phosphoesterase
MSCPGRTHCCHDRARGVGLTLAVLSDSHRNLKGLREVVKAILARQSVDVFIHLGDDFEDAEVFDEFGCDYMRVPGVFSDHYADRSVPNRIITEFEGWRFLLTHTRESHPNDLRGDLKPEEVSGGRAVDVMLYGHSHKPDLTEKDGILFVNPGHLKTSDKKGFGPSYAIIEIDRKTIDAAIVDCASGRSVKEITFRKGGTT